MKPIFEIKKEYADILDQIEENNGEITEEIENRLAINEGEIKQKGVAYAVVVKSMEAEQITIDNEIKRLQQLKKVRDNIISNLKDRLKYALEHYSIDEIKTETLKINFRKSKSVVVSDIDSLPEQCKKITVKVEPDKKLIKEMIEKGEFVNGAIIQENKNLQIK